jgi:hypothetical protein
MVFFFFSVENDQSIEHQNSSNGIRPSSSSSMAISNGNNQTLRNAFSHNPLNGSEKYLKISFFVLYKNYFRNQNRPPSRFNGILKSVSSCCCFFKLNFNAINIL